MSYFSAVSTDTLTLNGTAQGLTPSKIPTPQNPPKSIAFLTVEGGAVSYDFVQVPTATVGHQVTAGSSMTICGAKLMETFKVINVSTAATVKVTYMQGY